MTGSANENQEPLVSDAHSHLFHYTNEAGLYGILSSQCLWATHYAYLNDSQEFEAARKPLTAAFSSTVRQVAETLIEEGEISLNEGATVDQLARAEAENLTDIFYRVTLQYMTPYIFSFCSHSDDEHAYSDGLLSQWRAYGKNGGFAIEFDPLALEKLIEQDQKLNVHSNYAMTDVIYGERSKDFRFATKDIEAVASVARLVIPFALGHAAEPDLNAFQSPFAKVASRIKNSGFAEEREVRIIYLRPIDSTVPKGRLPPKPIEFRSRTAGCTPYVELFAHTEMRLPINRIVIGPHPRAELRKRTLELFLSQHGIEAGVDMSKIPYLPEN